MENKEILWQECNKLGRFLTIPGIYRHFKENKDKEDMIYCLSNVSIPIDFKTFKKEIDADGIHFFWHTELNFPIVIYRFGDQYYHNAETEKEILPIYTALYGDRKTYVRPLSMFLSKVDKEKYPDAKQKYRLELV